MKNISLSRLARLESERAVPEAESIVILIQLVNPDRSVIVPSALSETASGAIWERAPNETQEAFEERAIEDARRRRAPLGAMLIPVKSEARL